KLTFGGLLIVTAGTPADCSTVKEAEEFVAVSLAATAAATMSACDTPCPEPEGAGADASPPPPPPPHAASSTERAAIAPLPRRINVFSIPPPMAPQDPLVETR